MKPKEAWKSIRSTYIQAGKEKYPNVRKVTELREARCKVIDDLFAKAEPMPVAKIDNDFYCPKCRHITQYYNQTYCDICGQALDWSDLKGE